MTTFYINQGICTINVAVCEMEKRHSTKNTVSNRRYFITLIVSIHVQIENIRS